ncbi:MAG: 2-oxoglutarate synthase [Parcubacteria group bacterium]|nr:2-oxoglutarate synthase [Parcubacteria group bacterium]|tara:strand:- start:21528 stop:22373 length:846 start_codon:yes stop_codon:yes gene_type:complete
MTKDFSTKETITWCPGCPNFKILKAFKAAVAELGNRNIAIVSGVGCHAKIYDYINLKGFYGIHGRVLPVCLGIKMGNPKMTVVGFGGDGDTYNEGISHFIHNYRYNADMTMLVHNNQVFSLTTGQATATTEKGFIDGSTPLGLKERPLNPLIMALESGASFVARGYALDVPHLKDLIKQAILHKGFSFIDILQPCIIFHNVVPYFQKNVYKLKNHKQEDFSAALLKARQWDYCFDKDKKVPIGIFYQKTSPAFESYWPQLKKPWHTVLRKPNWQKIIGEFK